jgi:hypothetical protein
MRMCAIGHSAQFMGWCLKLCVEVAFDDWAVITYRQYDVLKSSCNLYLIERVHLTSSYRFSRAQPGKQGLASSSFLPPFDMSTGCMWR